MTIDLIISWCVSIIILIIAVSLLMGKGRFLIAGYNTASAKEKANYNKLKLSRVVGVGLLIISLIMMIYTYYKFILPSYLAWLIPWGYLGTMVIMLILANTICRKKRFI